MSNCVRNLMSILGLRKLILRLNTRLHFLQVSSPESTQARWLAVQEGSIRPTRYLVHICKITFFSSSDDLDLIFTSRITNKRVRNLA